MRIAPTHSNNLSSERTVVNRLTSGACRPPGEWLLTSSALALAVLLAERQAPPAGICASPTCGRPFVNVGRGSARRYCPAACGTRQRVAAHRQVTRGAAMKG
jgi:predicted RNA-binding Zn ribbon-like protein